MAEDLEAETRVDVESINPAVATPVEGTDREEEGGMSFDTQKEGLQYEEGKWSKLDSAHPGRSMEPKTFEPVGFGSEDAEAMRNRELPPLPTEKPVPELPPPESVTSETSRKEEGTVTMDKPQYTRSKRAPTSIHVASTRNPINGQNTFSSMVFVIQALESISNSKEARRRRHLGETCRNALNAIKAAAPDIPDPEIVYDALHQACLTGNVQVTTTALDTIGKLISYNFFSGPAAGAGSPPRTPTSSTSSEAQKEAGGKGGQVNKAPLIERAIDTICDCFQGEATADQVQLQVIKALLAAVLNDKTVVHGAGLLNKAIRQTYHIFAFSRSSANQITAQGTLTQMVHTVFERVKTRIAAKEEQLRSTLGSNGSQVRVDLNTSSTTINISTISGVDSDEQLSPTGPEGEGSTTGTETSEQHKPSSAEKITLQSFENRKSFDNERLGDLTVPRSELTSRARSRSRGRTVSPDGSGSQAGSDGQDEDDLFMKDAFLVFRSMCKLSIKNLPVEQLADLKSMEMRSKLLSLHLIHTILKSHMVVFTNPLVTISSSTNDEPTRFTDAVKQYLCLSLSRNAASAVGQVFEVCCEIFWLMLKDMRVMLKVRPNPWYSA